MGGWKDAPVVGDAGNAWERAPVMDNPSIPVRDIPAAVGRAAKQSALPIAGQLLGTAAGIATAPLTGPMALPATIGLESAGGAAGEYLNQKLGITEPSTNQILLQGAIPGGTRLLGGLMRPGMELAPPATKGAEFLNRIAAPEARLQLSKMAAPDAEALFNRAYQSGAMFHTGDTLPTIDRALRNLSRGANADQLYGRTIGILQNLRDRIAKNNGELDPRNYQTELRDLGAALRTAEGRTINQVEQGAVKDVYAAMASALDRESIPGPPRVTARFTPGRGRTQAPDEAIQPSVYEEYPGADIVPAGPRPQRPVERGMGSPTPLQPNVPSTEVNLPKFQPSQPMPFPQGGPPGLRQADEIIPAPGRPDPRVSAADAGNAERLKLEGPAPAPEDIGTIRFGVRSNARNAMAAQDLLLARQYVKRQAVLDEIEESVGKADKILRGQGDNTQFNAAAVLRDLKNNPFWNGTKGEKNPAFTAAEKSDIEGIFTLLNKLPALQPGAGVNAGSMRAWQRASAAGAGGTAGGLAGDPILATAGAAIGAAVPTVVSFARVLNIALRTETGRAELKALLRQPGATLQTITDTLTGAATASTAKPGPMQRQPTTAMPTPFPQEY